MQQINNNLTDEVNYLKSSNVKLSTEVARLIEVDRELEKAKEAIRHAEDELETKKFMVSCITVMV